MNEADTLIREFIGGDADAIARIADRARTSDEPPILLAAALLDPADPGLLARAATAATSARDRQLVAIAAAHLAGDRGRVRDLARDHLADHPDSLLAAWLAAAPSSDWSQS
jgi:hypothetical protein